jgi:hypothetical protein
MSKGIIIVALCCFIIGVGVSGLVGYRYGVKVGEDRSWVVFDTAYVSVPELPKTESGLIDEEKIMKNMVSWSETYAPEIRSAISKIQNPDTQALYGEVATRLENETRTMRRIYESTYGVPLGEVEVYDDGKGDMTGFFDDVDTTYDTDVYRSLLMGLISSGDREVYDAVRISKNPEVRAFGEAHLTAVNDELTRLGTRVPQAVPQSE